jgi:WhiB family transcriptional regulator, redox-sensing transcriptional regulator
MNAPQLPAPSSTDWRDLAACRDSDPELFFPVGNAGPSLLQVDRAKQVCAGCKVRTPCLEWALASGQEAGVWGGTSEDERRALRRTARLADLARPGGPGAPAHGLTRGPGQSSDSRNHTNLTMQAHPERPEAGR